MFRTVHLQLLLQLPRRGYAFGRRAIRFSHLARSFRILPGCPAALKVIPLICVMVLGLSVLKGFFLRARDEQKACFSNA
ncbi:hypothetical protein GCM10010232_28410 [Streptomyces amakusaensis]